LDGAKIINIAPLEPAVCNLPPNLQKMIEKLIKSAIALPIFWFLVYFSQPDVGVWLSFGVACGLTSLLISFTTND
jgi:hypothetical protein